MNIVRRLLCWLYGVDPAELDKMAQARKPGQKWADWARRTSRRL